MRRFIAVNFLILSELIAGIAYIIYVTDKNKTNMNTAETIQNVSRDLFTMRNENQVFFSSVKNMVSDIRAAIDTVYVLGTMHPWGDLEYMELFAAGVNFALGRDVACTERIIYDNIEDVTKHVADRIRPEHVAHMASDCTVTKNSIDVSVTLEPWHLYEYIQLFWAGYIWGKDHAD